MGSSMARHFHFILASKDPLTYPPGLPNATPAVGSEASEIAVL